jgi:hypothetical protein
MTLGYTTVLPTSLLAFLKLVRGFLMRYDMWLEEPLDILTKRFGTVEEDLHKLKHNCETLQLSLGRPLALMDNEFPDLWIAIEFLFASIKSIEVSEGMGDAFQALEKWLADFRLQYSENLKTCRIRLDELSGIKGRCDNVENLLQTHESRFQAIQPLLLSIRDLKTKLNDLQVKVDSIPSDTNTAPDPADPWMQNFAPLPDANIPRRAPCEHTAHSALGGTLQGVSRRSHGWSRPQELGCHGQTRQPEG